MSLNPKDIIFDDEAKKKLQNGINIASGLVSVTIGPKGRNVGITSWAESKITNSADIILEDLDIKDKFENMGIYFVKELFSKMKNNFLDGSKTSVILFSTLVNEAMKKISSGIGSQEIKKSLDLCLKKLLLEIDRLSIKVDKSEIESIAFAQSEEIEIAKNIKKCFELTDNISSINIQTNNKSIVEIENKEGLKIERGYLSRYFCNNLEKKQAEYENAKILITDKKIKSIHELLNILKMSSSRSFPLLIIADEIDKDVIATLAMNKIKTNLNVVAIRTPPYGDKRRLILEDIAYLTGGTFISEDKGLFLNETTFEDFGEASKIIVSKDDTLIIGGKGSKLDLRIKELEKSYEEEKDEVDKKLLKKRLNSLKGGVTTIKVGSYSEADTRRKKKVYEKTLFTVKKALEKGVVIGGGFALIYAVDNLKKNLEQSEKLGFELLSLACFAPSNIILKNSGFEPNMILDELKSKPYGYGFNVITEEIENFLDKKIVDPIETLKNGLISAVNMTNIVINSEVLIANE